MGGTPALSEERRDLPPEVHSLFLRPFLDDATEKLGRDRARSCWRELGVTEAQLRDPTAWVSLQFREQFFASLLGAGIDEGIFERCGRMVFTHKHAGILFPLLRAVGTPILAYGRIAQAMGRFNKVGRWSCTARAPGFVSAAVSTRCPAHRPRRRPTSAARAPLSWRRSR